VANPAVGIKDILVAKGLGTFAATTGWGIFIAVEPVSPDTAITIYNSGGSAPNPVWLVDYPSVQVRVRGTVNGYQAAYSKMVAVRDTLLGYPSSDLNGDRWVAVNQIGELVELGQDDSNRPLFVVNFRLIIEPAKSAESNREPI